MAWEKIDIMFPDGKAPIEDQMISTQEVKLRNLPYVTTTISHRIHTAEEYKERLVWYPDGTFKRYHIYDIGFDENKLPDGQSALNIYAQKILKDRILKIKEEQRLQQPKKRFPWYKRILKLGGFNL